MPRKKTVPAEPDSALQKMVESAGLRPEDVNNMAFDPTQGRTPSITETSPALPQPTRAAPVVTLERQGEGPFDLYITGPDGQEHKFSMPDSKALYKAVTHLNARGGRGQPVTFDMGEEVITLIQVRGFRFPKRALREQDLLRYLG